MKVAILSFDGFNELDSFIILGMLNRLRLLGWSAELCGPGHAVTSMNGVTVQLQRPLEWANEADVVIFGSGLYARAMAENSALLDRLQLDPVRQLIGAQCSGTLLLARLGLLGDMPACTDLGTKPWVVQAGARVLEEPFHARGAVATAGGSLAAQYLATWVMLKRVGEAATREVLHEVAPVGEKDVYAQRLLARVKPFVLPALA
ncbi:DJ-1/PfpI family protein [Paucibacter sp. B2R-40]|uniref:DJ-1/PfpI family protein n=1 Tax=Paucibacter sp. B2R-40 TaxID=2893554 RepID=UPI0021E46802|nr:DJ-1/PfpI family protein [Paucibacter sp. B2R-40]MCV2356698.1 DJ-1/PfpI family protein [Paucibacter sp. B2R-40]